MASHPHHYHGGALRLTLLAAALAGICAEGAAQIRTDASLGLPAQTLSGPAYRIPQSLGKLSGANLFHSFEAFSLAGGESATFSTSTAGIANVISRVTGGTPSQINGRIALEAASGAPAFFFINPAGVTFGAGAAIDVPGAFHVSTADYVQFADGRFHADLKQASTFSSAAPEAFGFLGANRASISIVDGAELGTPDSTFSVVAGDVMLDGGSIAGLAGEVRVVAQGGLAGEVPLAGPLPAAQGDLTMRRGAWLLTQSSGAAGGGAIRTSSGSLLIDGQGADDVRTGIFSRSQDDNAGNAGAVSVAVSGNARLLNGGMISSATTSAGDAGRVQVDVGGSLTVESASAIYSSTYGDGNAAPVSVNAARLTIDDAGANAATGIFSTTTSLGNAAAVSMHVNGAIEILNGGQVNTGTYGDGNGGAVFVRAGSLTVDGRGKRMATGIYSSAESNSSGKADSVDIRVDGALQVLAGGGISSSTRSTGDAGNVSVSAASLLVDGSGANRTTGITSDSYFGASGNGGDVTVKVSGAMTVHNGATVSASTFTDGNAGSVSVSADTLRVDGSGDSSTVTGIYSSSTQDRRGGRAGPVSIKVAGAIDLVHGGKIDSATASSGDAGNITIDAASLSLDDQDAGQGTSVSTDTGGDGKAGAIAINVGSLRMLGRASHIRSESYCCGDAGGIALNVSGPLTISGGGSISTSTFGDGHAGSVSVNAGSMSLDGYISSETTVDSRGSAGNIALRVGGALVINAGQVSSNSYGEGSGGNVNINAGSLTIDGADSFIAADAHGEGNAGNVSVSVGGALAVTGGAAISSGSYDRGSAGTVQVDAAAIAIDGSGSNGASTVNASAQPFSQSGQTGSVTVHARDSIRITNGAEIAIRNDAYVAAPDTLTPTLLTATAPLIVLDHSEISARSTGTVAASAIKVDAAGQLTLSAGSITTSASLGNGGAITLRSGGAITLSDGQVTTSVLGPIGNGGDISIHARRMFMNTGFIQANTAAQDAQGGLVTIDVPLLLASGGTLFAGGATPLVFREGVFSYNVIQAAAPTGLSGAVNLASPLLDLSGSLAGLSAQVIDTGGLGRNPCQASGGSSLAAVGRGGLPRSARTLLDGTRQTSASVAAQPLAMLGARECL